MRNQGGSSFFQVDVVSVVTAHAVEILHRADLDAASLLLA
jgi:hypothetical protein